MAYTEYIPGIRNTVAVCKTDSLYTDYLYSRSLRCVPHSLCIRCTFAGKTLSTRESLAHGNLK